MQVVADEQVAGVHKKADGQAEVGVSLGTDLSLLDMAATNPETNVTLYDAFQWRAVLSAVIRLGLSAWHVASYEAFNSCYSCVPDVVDTDAMRSILSVSSSSVLPVVFVVKN